MKRNESFEYEGFVVLASGAAMDVSGGKCMSVGSIAPIVRGICDFLADLTDFVNGFMRGFQRGYEAYR